MEHEVEIALPAVTLLGNLVLPEAARGVVLFAHGSGSSRLSPRNTFVANVLNEARIGTLLFDLMTEEEDAVYERRFDIDLLTRRLIAATDWVQNQPETRGQAMGYFGASTGAAAALKAAAFFGPVIKAVVSRGGRPDLAEPDLNTVQSPTLLIVGGNDDQVIQLNQQAYERLSGIKKIEIVPGATHLFEEPGALEEAARLAGDWFTQYVSK